MRRARKGVTIHDVAAAVGVSARTVSRVINRSPKVGGETRRMIEAAIESLGFHPSSRARGLSVGRSYLIGVVQDDPNAHVIGALQRGIVETASARGYELVVHPAKIDDPALTANIAAFVARSRVDGLILLPPMSERVDVAQALAAIALPTVAIAIERMPGCPFALISNERAAAAEVGALLVGLGHRRMAFVAGRAGSRASAEREAGFREELTRHGLTIADACRMPGDYGFAAGVAAGRALLALAEPPTAIFAANDIMAAGVLKAAHALGVAVPGQLSVVGFDDGDIALMVTPELSTVRRPFVESAGRATAELIDQIESGDVPDTSEIPLSLQLIVRGSTGPINA